MQQFIDFVCQQLQTAFMRYITTLFFCITLTRSFSQFKKDISLTAAPHFNFGTSGLGANDAGAGFGFNAAFFSKQKLQAIIESNYDAFFGDKILYVDAGRTLKNPSAYSVALGPQYFGIKNICVSATGGLAWHRIGEAAFSTDFTYRVGLTGFLGKKKHVVLNAMLSTIAVPESPVRYFSAGVGYRLL